MPLRRVGLAVGATLVATGEGDAGLRGGGLRASFSPLPQVALDGSSAWVGGRYHDGDRVVDLSGTRASLGATVMLYGRDLIRVAVAVAFTTTDAGPYRSHGVTYQLVSTMG